MIEKKWHGDKVNKAINDDVNKKLWAAGYMVEADAVKKCPVDTGRLKSSITTEVFPDREETEVSAGRHPSTLDGTIVEYALYVEKGTSKMSARPFLLPALLENENKIRKLFGK